MTDSPDDGAFRRAEREAVYRAIYERRDIRHYRPDPVPEAVLRRILDAAHHAASVGFMQPWSFVVIQDRDARQRIYDHFRGVNARAAEAWTSDRRRTYQALKLQGILDAPLNVLVSCDPDRAGPAVLGRTTMPETDVYSTCLAVQNFWLAARAEGVGVGWMSLMEPEVVADILGLPPSHVPVAYLTVGYPVVFPRRPMLSAVGWRERLPVHEVLHLDRFGAPLERLPEPPAPTPAQDLAPPPARWSARRSSPDRRAAWACSTPSPSRCAASRGGCTPRWSTAGCCWPPATTGSPPRG